MAKVIYIDSGAWLALADKRDTLHSVAVDAYPMVLRYWRELAATNLVVAETYTLILRRLGHTAAIHFLEAIRRTPRLARIPSDFQIEAQAEQILRRYADQDFSYVDAVSFAVMQERSITHVFAFDHHFTVAGFTLVPPLPEK